jgi:hypothetical protein
MLVTAKILGSRKPLFADFSVPLPPDWEGDGDGGRTLRDLISQVVRHEVKAFRKRQSDRQFMKALTATEIEAAAETGKVQMGESEVAPQNVDESDAIATALTAFVDGLFLVIIDETQYKELDATVFLTDDSRITFIRLTMLSGA